VPRRRRILLMTLTTLSLALLVAVLFVVFAVDNDDTAGERPFRRTWTYAGNREFYLKIAASNVELKYSVPLTGPYRGHEYVSYHVLGFKFSNVPYGRPSGRVMNDYQVVLSTTSLFLLSLVVPAFHFCVWMRRQNGALAGKCTVCGYDLRATPDRCPECGVIRRQQMRTPRSQVAKARQGPPPTEGLSEGRGMGGSGMAEVTRLTRETYAAFVGGHRFAAVLFDAPAWDMTYRLGTEQRFASAAVAMDGRAAFGFVDVDGPEEVELCRMLPLANVPTVAYYRDGTLVRAVIGIGQDYVACMTAVIDGRPISRAESSGGDTTGR
jgi:hypothetical protein